MPKVGTDSNPREGIGAVTTHIGAPEGARDPKAQGGPTLVDAKIGDINNRAVYASGIIEPMEEALKNRARELIKESTRSVPDRWLNHAAQEIAKKLQDFVSNEVFRAEGYASLKAEQRVGLRAYMENVREDILRKDYGSLTRASDRINAETGGMSLDEYMKQREQREIINFQLSQEIDRRIQIPWRDIKLQYEKDFEKYNPPPTAIVRLIMVPESSATDVKAVEDALASGKTFAEVASGKENTFRSKEGGRDEKIFKGEWKDAEVFPVKELADLARSLTPGTWKGPVTFSGNVAWIALDSIEQKSRTLYDAQLAIENELFSQRRDKEVRRYVGRLQDRASLTNMEEMHARLLAYAYERCLLPVMREQGVE
jgi:hypothetical protein